MSSAKLHAPKGHSQRLGSNLLFVVWQSPWLVAIPIIFLAIIWLIMNLPYSHGGLDFAEIGPQFQHSHASTTIKLDPAYLASRPTQTGYDGQFYYYIAADPLNARDYLDAPAYRYTRIIYPLVARFLALGQIALIPYTLLLVNLLAIAGGSVVLAYWLRRKGYSPAFALIYGLYPGQFVSFTLDLTEPLAYTLVMLGVYVYEFGPNRRLVWSALIFGLAALTREISVIFPALYTAALLLSSRSRSIPSHRIRELTARLATNWSRALLFGVLSTGPLVLYKIFLTLWLGSSGVTDYSLLQLPFQGLLSLFPWQPWNIQEMWGIDLPAIILLVMALWAIWRRVWAAEVWILLVNIEVCVFGLTATSYDFFLAPSRIAMGVALAALLCLPHFDKLSSRMYVTLNRWLWLGPCTLLWILLALDWQAVIMHVNPE